MRIFNPGLVLFLCLLPLSLSANGFAGLYDFPEPEDPPVPTEQPIEPEQRSVLEDGVPGLDIDYGEGMPSLSSLSSETEDISQEAIEARDRALARLNAMDEPTCKTGDPAAQVKDLLPLENSLRRSQSSGLMNRTYQRRMIKLTPDC